MTPKRIQRKRTKGWRMPEGAVYVGRPSRWGNPFPVRAPAGGWHSGAESDPCHHTREHSVAAFREYVTASPRIVESARRELAGRDLACWCPLDQPCHADVLLELANPEPTA